MERLTSYESDCKREMICRYEDCDTCEENCPHLNEDNCPCLQEILEKLAEYQDLDEKGKLMKLPCAVGDRIYRIDTDEKIGDRKIEFYDIDNIVILSDGTVLLKYDTYDGVICELENIVSDKPYLDFYRCFLTRLEAERALEEMEGKK